MTDEYNQDPSIERRPPPRTAEDREQHRVNLLEQSLDTERIRAITVPTSGNIGALLPTNALQAADWAKMMAVSGSMVPPFLRGNAGGCLGIVLKACRLMMDPFEVANWAYEVEQSIKGSDDKYYKVRSVAYMSGFYNAVILSRAPIKGRPRYTYSGEGDQRRCTVSILIRGETERTEMTTNTLGALRPAANDRGQTRGSPLWVKKPDQQLAYNVIRDLAKLYFPDVVAGIMTIEDLEETFDEPVDVTPPPLAPSPQPEPEPQPETSSLISRLRPRATGEGFNHAKEKIEAEIAMAVAAAEEAGRKKEDAGAAQATAPEQVTDDSAAGSSVTDRLL
jgi:hypothetical protein